MKKQGIFIPSIIAIIFLFFVTSLVFAQGSAQQNPFTYGVKTSAQQVWPPKVTSCTEGDFGQCMLFVLNKVLAIIYTLALFLAVIFLVYAGIEYITKPGEAGKTHQRLVYGITGIVVAVVAFSLVKAIELGLTGGSGGSGTIVGSGGDSDNGVYTDPVTGDAVRYTLAVDTASGNIEDKGEAKVVKFRAMLITAPNKPENSGRFKG